MLDVTSLVSAHARHVLTPWSRQGASDAPMIVRGEGSYLYDAESRRYLDLSSGLVCVNLGHGHPRVVQAIRDQAGRLCYAPPALGHDVRAELAAELSRIAPWPQGARVFFTTAGAEANEDAVKLVRMLTRRPKVLTAYRSFHGSTIGASTLTGEDRRWAAEPGIPGVVHFFAPYPYRSPFHTDDPAVEVRRALDHLELVLLHEDPTRVAAIMLEPVVGSNGVIVYPDGYLAGVRDICSRHGILLVFDEVMTGFGRTGAAFAAQRFGVTPDVITFAKGVTSAYVPLGGVLLSETLARRFDDEVMWVGHTYSGHPLAMAAGLAALRAYGEEGLFDRARTIEPWLREGLAALAGCPLVGDVRGVGAMFGLELVSDRADRRPLVPWHGQGGGAMKALFAGLRRRGVYAFGKFNIVVIAPPLTIDREDLERGLDAVGDALTELAATRS